MRAATITSTIVFKCHSPVTFVKNKQNWNVANNLQERYNWKRKLERARQSHCYNYRLLTHRVDSLYAISINKKTWIPYKVTGMIKIARPIPWSKILNFERSPRVPRSARAHTNAHGGGIGASSAEGAGLTSNATSICSGVSFARSRSAVWLFHGLTRRCVTGRPIWWDRVNFATAPGQRLIKRYATLQIAAR